MDIYLDMEVLLDGLFSHRERHEVTKKVVEEAQKRGDQLWLPACEESVISALVDNLASTADEKEEARQQWENLQKHSRRVTPLSAALGTGPYHSFFALAPQGLVIAPSPQKESDQILFCEEYIDSPPSLFSKGEVPLLDLTAEYRSLAEEIDDALLKVARSGRFIFGPQVSRFESRMAEYLGVQHAIGVASGTDALVLALRAQAILKKGEEFFDSTDEIITTPFTFTATGDAILRAGATPVFVDIDPETFNLQLDQVRRYLEEEGESVVGILPVHLYGQGVDMEELCELADEGDCFVLEDVAQSLGAHWEGKKLGTLATAGAFSFFPTKNLGAYGDGGLVATNDEEISELVRILLRHGGKSKYNAQHIGYNSRLDAIQAAVLNVKVSYLDRFNAHRQQVASDYRQYLDGIKGLTLPKERKEGDHVYHQFTLRTSQRDALREHLREKNISSMIYYPVCLHKMEVFQNRMKVPFSLEKSEKSCHEVLSLPISPFQRGETTKRVAREIRRFFDGE